MSISVEFINSGMFTEGKMKRIFCACDPTINTLEEGLCTFASFERVEIYRMYPAVFIVNCDSAEISTVYDTFGRDCKLLRNCENKACFLVSLSLTRLLDLLQISRKTAFRKIAKWDSKLLISSLASSVECIFWLLNMLSTKKPEIVDKKKQLLR